MQFPIPTPGRALLAVLAAVLSATTAKADDADAFPLGGLGGKALQQPGTGLIKITGVTAGGPAATAGIQVGDFVHSVNGVSLPITSTSINDGWRGAVSELGYAIERAESSGGALSLDVLRPGSGAVTLNATLSANTAWRTSYPAGDPRAADLFEKACADLHTKIQASSTGDFGYNTGWFGMTLLASPNWNDTTGAKPYRNSINKIKDRCIAHLNGRILEPVEPSASGYVSPGLENWDIVSSCMFIGEYRRKTGDTSVDADVQRCALLLANRIQHYSQPDDGGTMHNKFGIMGHGGVTGDYAHLWLTGLNIINAHTMVAMGILKGAGADFSTTAGSSGLTIDQKFLMNWSWLKSCTRTDNGSDDGCVGYQGVETGWDAAGRTAGSAAGYQIYLNAGGTAATADDLDKLARMKAYVVRHWQRQQHAHAYTAGGVALSQCLMPFLTDRDQRYFMENSRFYYTLTRDHTGAIQYVPGRGNNGGDSSSGYLGFDNVKYYYAGLFQAMGTGNLPSFPAPSTTRAFVRMNSPANDWPQLAARRARLVGLVQNLDLVVTNNLGDALTNGYTATWTQVSGSTVAFSYTTSEDTTVTFPSAGNYRLRLTATVGTYTVTEDYDFEVATSVTPPVANAITTQPLSRTGTPGGSATFTVGTTGDGPFLYEWKLNGTAYWGTSSNGTLSIGNLAATHAGTYTCSIYTPTGTLTSNAAILTIPTTTTLTNGGLKREVWTGISGSSVANLTGNMRYPLFPDVTGMVTTAEGPNGYAENYGQRLSGWLVPPTTGQYKFYLTSDDASELWLSTTDSSANKVKITQVIGYTGYRQYSSGGQSALINLTAGQRYYIEALQKEGGGGDHLSIAWQTPGGTAPANDSAAIDGSYLQYNLTSADPTLNGLVSWWKMDDASGTIAADALSTANDGTLNAPVWAAGKRGGALVFDGNDRVTCSNLGALNGTTPFTVTAWVKVNAGANADAVVIQQRTPSGFNGQYQLKITAAGKAGFYVYGNSAEQFNFAGATSINDGQWHHIAGVRDGAGNAYIYVDGVQDASVTGTTVRSLSSSIGIGIGCDIRDSNKYFRGSIDDIRIYNYALTQAQVAEVSAIGNTAPVFNANPFSAAGAFDGYPYSASIATAVTDPESDAITYTKLTGPAWLQIASNGSLSGTPATADLGTNTFTVRASDTFSNHATATFTIEVTTKPNTPPAFNSDPVVKSQATPSSAYSGTLASDVTDPDPGALIFEKLSGPAWLLVAADGSLTGTPPAGDAGMNSFIIRVSDAQGGSDIALVTIQIGPSAGYPANNYGTLAGTNTSDEYIQRVQLADLDKTSGNNNGYADFKSLIAQLTPGQAAAYVLTPGFTGVQFKEAWTIWIDLNRDGDFADSGEQVLQLAGTTDVRTGSFTVPSTASVGPSRMRIAMKYNTAQTSPTGTFTYGEVEDYSVQIGTTPPANAAPYFLANPITWPEVAQGTPVSGSLATHVADWENHALTFSKVSGPTWLVVGTDGTLGGTPANSHVGFNSFQIQVTDSLGATATATLQVTVTNTNDAPVFAADPINLNATEDAEFIGQLAASDVDAGDSITFAKASGPTWLNVSTSGALSGTPTNADVGPNNFTVSVSDGTATVNATLNITVTNTNDAPVFAADPINVSANEDAEFTGQLAASDMDAGDMLTFVKLSGPSWLAVSSTGALGGNPANSDVGPNVFTVQVTDTSNVSVTATLNITVANTNDTPVFATPVITGSGATQDAPYSGSLAGTASDPDIGDNLTYAKTNGPAWLAVAGDGSLTGTPAAADAGPNTFEVRVTDAGGLVSNATLEIHVTAANPDANDNGILDAWENEKFGNTNPGANDPGEDADGDGLSNLLEFALDTHPQQANASPLSWDIETIGADRYLRLTVPKNPVATNLTYTVEVCGDLATQSWSKAQTAIEENSASLLRVRDTVDANTATRRFIRLKVSVNP